MDYFYFLMGGLRIFFLVVGLLYTMGAAAQQHNADTREQLEDQRKEILREIKETEQQLTTLKSDKKVTFTQLKVLQEKLTERALLIGNIQDEVKYIDLTIAQYSKQIAGLRKKLEHYKVLYTRSIRYSYKSRTNLNMLAYLCAAQDFNDVVRRMKYLRIMRAMRQQQSEQIRATHEELYHKIDMLTAERAGKDKLLQELSGQNATLEIETKEANESFKEMAGREKELQAELQEKKKSAKRISDAITAIIRQEMKHSEDEFKAAHKPKPYEPDVTEDTDPDNVLPEHVPIIGKDEMLLARKFEKKKGQLGWPVTRGRISCHFGKYNLKNIEYYNNGVDIRTVTYGIVNAVYDGRVSSVVEMDGKVIIIVKHGNYFSVYNNLLRGMVLKGQKVVASQPLGLVGQNEEGFPTLNFQIWKSGGSKHETMMLNPEAWIRKNPVGK